jgi:hypothetical protein
LNESSAFIKMTSFIFFPVFKTYIKVSSFFRASHIDNADLQIIITDSTTRIKTYKISTFFHYLYVIAMFLVMCSRHLTIPRKLQGVLFLVAYGVAACTRTGFDLDDEPIKVINSFLNYEKHLITSKNY